MEKVYDISGGYTNESNRLDSITRELLKDVIKEEIAKGTPIEVLEYVLYHAIHTEILRQKLIIRANESNLS